MTLPSAPSTGPVAETLSGQLRGIVKDGVFAFRGIPYGAPAGGGARFRIAQPAPPWSGVRDASGFGDRAMQAHRPHAAPFEWLDSPRPMSEDCLSLNVTTPGPEGRRDVMVWLHGGAFAFGSGDLPGYDPAPLVRRKDVVVVTLNHRLNLFGYLTPTTGDDRFATAANNGMLDIVLALEWVRDNIAAFGGNPGSVTLFGQSGGGAKVAILMAMAEARGLFHKAIIQSTSSGFRVQEADAAHEATERLLHRLSLGPADFAQLQTVPAARLLAEMPAVTEAMGGDNFRPAIDGRVLGAHPFVPQAPGLSRDIPMLIGHTADEMRFFLASDPNRGRIDAADARRRLARFLPVDETTVDALIALYAQEAPDQGPEARLAVIAGDYMYRAAALEGAEARARQSGAAPVWFYDFRWRSPAQDGYLGAPHTAEIPFIFGQTDLARDFTGGTEDARALSHRMMDIWAAFAATGDPGGAAGPDWPPYDMAARRTMILGDGPARVESDPLARRRAAIAALPRCVPGAAYAFRSEYDEAPA